LINGFTVFFPSKWSVSGFFTAYVGIPIFLVLYFVHRIIYRYDKWAWDAMEVDLKTGMKEVEDSESPLKKRKGFMKIMAIVE